MCVWAGGGAATVQGLKPAKWTNRFPPGVCVGGGASDSKNPPSFLPRLNKQQRSEKQAKREAEQGVPGNTILMAGSCG